MDQEKLIATMPNQGLQTIASKAINHQRITAEEGLTLLTSDDVEAVGRLADFVRRRDVGDTVYFATTYYIHPTNLCELSCPMCSFYAKPGWEKAWFLTPEEAEQQIREAYTPSLTEIHIVGGLWRECDLSYYQELFTRIRTIDPNLHIKALTPVEYDFLAKLHGLSIDEVFSQMKEWGLGSLPGGGAEVLVEEIRKKIAPGKITTDEYLEIHKMAHRSGLPSNITMLFGHIEEPHHLITHLCRVREVQDETGGFRTFVPLKYHVENNALGKRKTRLKPPPGLKQLYATCRLMLDNVPNLKVLWNYVGVELAQELLNYGGNDFSSTNTAEKIIVMAGGIGRETTMNEETITTLIAGKGRLPKKIHSGHHYEEEQVALCQLTP